MAQGFITLAGIQLAVFGAAAGAFIFFAFSAAHVLPACPAADTASSPWGRRLLRFAALVLVAVHLGLVATRPVTTLPPLVAALVLYGIAIALSFWAGRTLLEHPPASLLTPTVRLVVHGPFRLFRQPFYTACLCAWAGGCLATSSSALLVITAWVAALYFVSALYEEQRAERSVCADAYREYRRSTGIFLPRIQIEFGEPARPTYLS